MNRHSLVGLQEFADVAVRVVFRGWLTVKLRGQASDRAGYIGNVDFGVGGIGLAGTDSTDWLKPGLDLGKDYQPDAEHEFVFAACGNELIYCLDGKLVSRAQHDGYKQGWMELTSFLDPNRKEVPTRIKKVEYLVLDGLSEAEALKAAGIPAPSTPTWTDATDYIRAEGLAKGILKQNGEWLEPTRQSVFMVMNRKPLPPNVALRIRFADRIVADLRKTEGSGIGFYELGVGGPLGYIVKSTDGQRTTLVPPLQLGSNFADGSEHELILVTHGDRLHLLLDGKSHLAATDPSYREGGHQLLFFDDGPNATTRLRKVEWMTLEGLSEAEALKAAGIPAVAAGEVPYPGPGYQGKLVYPVGVWARMQTREKEAERLANPKNKRDGDWERLEDGAFAGGYQSERKPMTNLGIRARFRGQRTGEDYPQMNLRGVEGSQPAFNLHIRNGKVQIRKDQPGYPVLAEAPLREPLGSGKEYDMEFYAIGRQLIARVNGQVLNASTDEDPAPGHYNLFGSNWDYFRDAQVLNLDGLTEAEALKVAGFPAEVP